MKLEKAVLKRFMGNRSILGWYHWAKAQKHILFGKHNLSFGDRLWCWRYGFHTGDLNLYGRENLKKNYKDYLSARDYYSLHPLNGEYSFWIDDKMTMKYILSKYNEYLPEYYFQLDKNSILKLVDCPKEKNADYESIVALLREKRILACKRLFGACGIGFYRLEFDGTDYMVVMDTHRDHFGTPAYVKDKFMHMSEIRTEGTGYMVVFANEAFQTLDESNAYWEKMYALYEEGKIDPNGENEYQPFPLTMIYTVWEQ